MKKPSITWCADTH